MPMGLIMKHKLMAPLWGGGGSGGSSFPYASTFIANNKSRAQFDVNKTNVNTTISGLTISSAVATANFQDTRTDVALTGGKIYYEFTVAALGGSAAILSGGLCDSSYVPNSQQIGNEATPHSIGISLEVPNHYVLNYMDGDTSFASGTIAVGNVIGVAIDMGNEAIWARLGAGNWNNNASANPATNIGGLSLSNWLGTGVVDIFPCGQLNTGDVATNASLTFNFGATAWANTPPVGFI